MDRPEFAHVADIPRARKAIADVCALMHQRGYIVAGDGNVSVRIGDSRLLVTPSGARKGFMEPADLVLTDLDGNPVRGEKGRPSSELAMHVAIYQERPDARAVVHAHPPCAIAHTIAGISLGTPLMPEAFCELGEIHTLPYSTPGTRQVPDALRAPVRNRHCALVMERHGSITFAGTLGKAYDRLEILEHVAKISLMSRLMAPGGRIDGLEDPKLDQLRVLYACGAGC